MSFETPDDLYYAETHEWIDPETGRVGISDFAQDELGDIVFVELPDSGESVTAGDELGIVESIKAISDIYAPVSGDIEVVNEAVVDEPELINVDPYGEGWLVQLSVTEESELEELLPSEAYEAQLE